MKTLLALIVPLLLALTAGADVVIYKITSTNLFIGSGTTYRITRIAHIIADADTGYMVEISRWTQSGQKYYAVDRTQPQLYAVTGLAGVHTIVALAATGYDGGGFPFIHTRYARGKNAYLEIRPGRTIIFPLAFTVMSRAVVQYDHASAFVIEENGVAKFLPMQTRANNELRYELEVIVWQMINNLQLQGYIEMPVAGTGFE